MRYERRAGDGTTGAWGRSGLGVTSRAVERRLDIRCNHELRRAPRGPDPNGSDPRAPPVPSLAPQQLGSAGLSLPRLREWRTSQRRRAYYLNSKIPALALVAKGVRFPAGMWIRVAESTVPAWQVEDMRGSAFPALRGRMLRFESFTSEEEVKEFERSLPPP